MKEYFKRLYNKTSKSFYKLIKENLKNEKKQFIVTANPETFMKAEQDEIINNILLDKDTTIVPDGIGIVKAAQILDYDIKERIPGIDIAVKLLEYGNELKKSIYLFGAQEEVIISLKEVLTRDYPNLKIIGAKNGYEKDRDKVFKDIIKKEPDIVLVALGIPEQEKLIYKYLDKFKKGIFVGVGGSFDVISGHKKRAPKIFQKLNLEWLYRILKEPKRIKRFYDSNVKFLFKVRKLKKKEKFSITKTINNFKLLIKNNWLISIILLIAVILHILAFNELGFEYSLNSDDASYVNAGITFLQTGQLTMHGVLSAQVMPGMTFLIAFFALIFGTGSSLMFALKVFWILMGLTTILYLYKIMRLYTNPIVSALPCMFLLSLDYVWMNNLILTETPFLLLFILLVYHSLKFSIEKQNKDYIMIIVWYIICLFIRPNIGLFPIFLFVFLLLRGFKLKDLVRKGLIAGGILICVLLPWTYRNYKVFNNFIPLTYGTGNPLLLGTYQGVGFPSDEELDYVKNVDEKMSDEMKYYLKGNPQDKIYLKSYYSLEYDHMKATYRMKEWWNKDKLSMIKSYLIYKPKILIYSSFYWKQILGISINVLLLFRKIELLIFGLSSLIILLKRKYIKEWFFLLLVYLSQIALYAYTFAFDRYAITLFFIRYIIIGLGLDIIVKYVCNFKSRRSKHESISNNSSIQ